MIGSGYISVAAAAPGGIKQALNQSGWLADEVLAAGHLRQGKAPTLAGMITGTALIELAKPRRSKALPRQFVLAVTADRIVAFKAYGGGGDEGPYIVRIKPGECGAWPRASVRLVDLPDGAHSKGGTLELAGSDGFDVSRPNLAGDRNTDELIDLLGGGAASTRDLSPRRARRREDQDELRRAAELRSGDYRELAADATRGRPDVDLAGWAARRGLEPRGSVGQGGHLSVTCPWSEDVLFNVVRGRWPGGTHGVLCHEARIYADGTPGYFHGGEANGGDSGWSLPEIVDWIAPLPVGGGGQVYFKVPYTSAGARVPHLGAVTGLHVARRAERHTGTDARLGLWEAQPLDEPGVRGHWIAAVRKHSDAAAVEQLLSGPIRALLSEPRPLGFEIRIEYGQVIVSRQDFLKTDAELDELVAAAEQLAGAVRERCLPTGQVPLDAELPPPAWLDGVRRKPRDEHTLWPMGARLEKVVRIADARGLAIEDPRAFHAAFPGLNVPGEAFAVLRGRLPGTALTGRLLCCAERPMTLPDDFRRFLSDPGGAVGCDVVVLPVPRQTPPTPAEGEPCGSLRVAVADGVLTAWRVRPSWQADVEALDRLVADVEEIVGRRAPAG